MSGHYDSDVSDSDRPSKRKQRQIDLKAAKAGGGTVCPVVPSLITDQVLAILIQSHLHHVRS